VVKRAYRGRTDGVLIHLGFLLWVKRGYITLRYYSIES